MVASVAPASGDQQDHWERAYAKDEDYFGTEPSPPGQNTDRSSREQVRKTRVFLFVLMSAPDQVRK